MLQGAWSSLLVSFTSLLEKWQQENERWEGREEGVIERESKFKVEAIYFSPSCPQGNNNCLTYALIYCLPQGKKKKSDTLKNIHTLYRIQLHTH